MPLSAVLGNGLYEQEESEQAEGWLDSLNGHTPETEGYGISSFIYRARRPFHPEGFSAFLQAPWEGVIRAKGMFWLATLTVFHHPIRALHFSLTALRLALIIHELRRENAAKPVDARRAQSLKG